MIPWHVNVIKWKHFLRYWSYVWGINRSPVNSLHKGQWRGALMFSLICAWIDGWVNNCEAGDLRCHCTHYDVIVMTNKMIPDSVKPHLESLYPTFLTVVEQITVRIVKIMIQATDLAQILYGGHYSRKERGPRKISIWPPFFKMAAMGYH